MIYEDRLDASRHLLERLLSLRIVNPLILAVPRGAVPMAAFIARELGCPMSIAPVRKVASPLAPEFALGAVDVEGNYYPDEEVLEFPQEQLRSWFRKSLEVLRQRNFRWRQMLPHAVLKSHSVIVVDDGVATGATMRAALLWARRKEPARLVAAVPVSSQSGLAIMHRFADQVLCLEAPRLFSSVGEFYRSFEEISDDEVCGILRTFSEVDPLKEKRVD
jgi:putative phosphoribosyl transferase